MPAGSPGEEARHARWTGAAALAGYCVLAFGYFGLRIAAHPGRTVVGHGTDPDIFVWSFGWWAYAIPHGENPIYTHSLWAPSGFNLAWAATAPGLAALFSPLTLAAGPVVSYNAAAVLMPALAAWTAFLLCRYLTRALWPSLAGGYLFGFSSYMLAEEEGHLHVTVVFLVPLVALVVLRYLDGRLGARALALWLGLLLAFQLWFSTEILATLTLALAVALALAFLLVRTSRARLRSLLAPLAGGYALAAVLGSPLLYYMLTDFQTKSITPPGGYVADLANFVIPTRLTALGGSWAAGTSAGFPGNEAEQVAYLGIPTLAVVAWFAVRRRRTPTARFLLASFAVAVLAAFGNALHVAGVRIVVFPWRLVSHLPLFNNIIPVRLLLYAVLAAAVLVALFAVSPEVPRWLRTALPLLAVLALAPNLGSHAWFRTPDLPEFFATAEYTLCVAPGDNVLVLPYGYTGDSLLWQAVAGFRFRVAGGNISPRVPPAPFAGTTPIRLINDHVPFGGAADILALAREHGVRTILVEQSDPVPWSSVLAGVDHPVAVGGMLVYALEPGPAESGECRRAADIRL